MPARLPAVDPARLAQWCEEHLGSPAASEIFRSGYLSAVIGLRLADSRAVVVKVRPDSPRVAACVEVQRRLFESGYPCPEPLTGATAFGDGVATAEAYVPGGALLPSAGRSAWAFAGAFARLLVVHDWDSITADSEAVLAGFAAALYSTVSVKQLATVEETQRFLVAYRDARGRELSADELERSWAAGVWTRAYDARYQHAVGQPVLSLTESAARERLHRAGIG